MAEGTYINIDKAPVVGRGGGIVTRPLIVRHNTPEAKFTTGMTRFPPGQGAPMHTHNCDEQVTVLEGTGIYEVDLFLKSVNPQGLQRRASAWSPGIPGRARRVGVIGS